MFDKSPRNNKPNPRFLRLRDPALRHCTRPATFYGSRPDPPIEPTYSEARWRRAYAYLRVGYFQLFGRIMLRLVGGGPAVRQRSTGMEARALGRAPVEDADFNVRWVLRVRTCVARSACACAGYPASLPACAFALYKVAARPARGGPASASPSSWRRDRKEGLDSRVCVSPASVDTVLLVIHSWRPWRPLGLCFG